MIKVLYNHLFYILAPCISFFLLGCGDNNHKIIPSILHSAWVSVSSRNFPEGRVYNSIVYSGKDIIIWGGSLGVNNATNTGEIYNLESNTWKPTSTGLNCPSNGRCAHTAIWTGDKMIIWGGANKYEHYNDGGVYDPLTDTWAPISTSGNCPSLRAGHSAVWTGDKMIIWGGEILENSTYALSNTGAIYDPDTDTWTSISTGSGCPYQRIGHLAAWTTDNRMLIFAGVNNNLQLWNGGWYDPETDTWEPINSEAPSPYPYYEEYSSRRIIAGNEIIVWGGTSIAARFMNDGAIYNLLDNTWRLTSKGENCPSPRIAHTAIWTGSKMIIWGGETYDGVTNTGCIYDPATDTWEEIKLDYNTPSPRLIHSAIWIGDSMFIWGGLDKVDNPLNAGGIYTPPDP